MVRLFLTKTVYAMKDTKHENNSKTIHNYTSLGDDKRHSKGPEDRNK